MSNNITDRLGKLYHPIKALVIYKGGVNGIYVEAHDINAAGFLNGAHPLTVTESAALAKALHQTTELERRFLQPTGILAPNVLHINHGNRGFAMWYTPAQRKTLLFAQDLGIPSGTASLPALLWKATKDRLQVFALKNSTSLQEDALLYCAPFFNIHHNGSVCMGTVDIDIQSDCRLEKFIDHWERYFFESYFSHLIGDTSPVKGNIVQLWQHLVNTRRKFPISKLHPSGLTIKDLIL